MDDKLVTGVVVNYNAGALLVDSIQSMLDCPVIDRVIVVDNDSTDGSLKLISGFSNVVVIENKSNLGFAAACNIGLSQAKTDFILFLNPDCFFKNCSINTVLNALLMDSSVGMAGGVLVNADGTEQPGGRRKIPTPWRSFVRAFGFAALEECWPKLFSDFHLHLSPLPEFPVEVEAISGACMLVRRQAVDDVGLWDEGYFLHCEDLDWCMRFRAKGWKIMFVPDAQITHHQGACSRSRPIFVEWHKHNGMIRFYKKFFRDQYPGPLLWVVILGVYLRFSVIATFFSFRHFLSFIGFRNG